MVDGGSSLLVATTNLGKFAEVKQVLADFPIPIVGLADWPDAPEAVEDGATFDENARLKALHYAKLTGCWALADDSGLEVDALGGKPGVHSARYSGPQATDATNNAKLISELREFTKNERTARFRCAMALAFDGKVYATTSGAVEGNIIDEPAGDNGFGYDPHFFVAEHGVTVAQMPPELKNSISHRGQALRKMTLEIKRCMTH